MKSWKDSLQKGLLGLLPNPQIRCIIVITKLFFLSAQERSVLETGTIQKWKRSYTLGISCKGLP